mgnify:CR=1 FL=1
MTILTSCNIIVNQCFICNNNSTKNQAHLSICNGCLDLIKHPQFDCLRCGVELQTEHSICGSCQKHPPQFTQVNYVGVYQSPIDRWVKSLKFGKNILISKTSEATRASSGKIIESLMESNYVPMQARKDLTFY